MAGWTYEAGTALALLDDELVAADVALRSAATTSWRSPAGSLYAARLEHHARQVAHLLRAVRDARTAVLQHTRTADGPVA